MIVPITSHFNRLCLMLALMITLSASLPVFLAAEDSRWQVIPDLSALEDYHVPPNSTALAKALADAAEHLLRIDLPQDANGWQKRRSQVELTLRKSYRAGQNACAHAAQRPRRS